MIASFKDDEARKVFEGTVSRRLPSDIQRVARRKLIMLDSAQQLRELLIPPGNQLEALKGDRVGQHSIRINSQWRLCFVWRSASEGGDATGNGDACDVEITDYH